MLNSILESLCVIQYSVSDSKNFNQTQNTMTFSRYLMIAFLSLMTVCLPASASDAIYTQVGKVVTIGDLHGDYKQYIELLKDNELIDDNLKWTGGDVHFVQLGDVTDRGPDSLKIIRHLMKLEKQARRAGGKVHPLIGNHEAMNVQTDLRYVHPGEYKIHVTKKSERLQKRYVDAVLKSMLAAKPELGNREAETRAKLERRYPLGYVEHRMMWEPGQELARWYARRNAIVQINDVLYLHGGLDPHVEDYLSLDEINQTIRSELKEGARPMMSVSPKGPLWYRGLARHPEEKELEPLERMLDHYDVTSIVIGHSPTAGVVLPRFDGKVIRADVGISAHYGSGHANLIIEDGVTYTMHRGNKLPLPNDAGVEAYLEEIYKLEEEGSRYREWKDGKAAEITAAAD